jgi:hypothetical protein
LPPLACSFIAAASRCSYPVWVLIFNGERPGPASVVGGIIVILAVTAQCIAQDRMAAKALPDRQPVRQSTTFIPTAGLTFAGLTERLTSSQQSAAISAAATAWGGQHG